MDKEFHPTLYQAYNYLSMSVKGDPGKFCLKLIALMQSLKQNSA